MKSNEDIFTAKDASINTFDIPREALRTAQQEIDLLEGPRDQGRPARGRGAVPRSARSTTASPSRTCTCGCRTRSPLWNYIKAQLGIWVQMVLVIAIGVTCSTLLNGPVAMLFTVVVHPARILQAVLRRRRHRQAGRRRPDRVAGPAS